MVWDHSCKRTHGVNRNVIDWGQTFCPQRPYDGLSPDAMSDFATIYLWCQESKGHSWVPGNDWRWPSVWHLHAIKLCPSSHKWKQVTVDIRREREIFATKCGKLKCIHLNINSLSLYDLHWDQSVNEKHQFVSEQSTLTFKLLNDSLVLALGGYWMFVPDVFFEGFLWLRSSLCVFIWSMWHTPRKG